MRDDRLKPTITTFEEYINVLLNYIYRIFEREI